MTHQPYRPATGPVWPRRRSLPRRAVWRAARVLRFLGYFTARLVIANLVVAREIVTPGSGLSPGIVEFQLRTRTRSEVVLMALAVGLTPGTLTVAIREEPPTLYVHGMHAEDPARFRAELSRLQDRMLPALRPVTAGDPAAGAPGADPAGADGADPAGGDGADPAAGGGEPGRPEGDLR